MGPLIIGAVIFGVTVAAWLIAESQGISTGPLLGFAVPVVAALFLAPSVSATRHAAEATAAQTNGVLDGRMKAAVSAALADRDAARTRQMQGDISEAGGS